MKGKSAPFRMPKAAQKPVAITMHGETRTDEYTWLQDAESPETLAYIKAENEYANHALSGTKRLQNTLYKEIRARITEEDKSVPVKDGPYLYYTRTKRGKQYAIYCRIACNKNGRAVKGAKEEIILDENELAKHADYFSLGALEVSPDHTLLAYTVDTKGNEDHTLYVKKLETSELLSERIPHVADVLWSNDGSHLFYTVEDHPHPPRTLMRHVLYDDPANDVVVYREGNEQWYVSIGKTRSREYIVIYAANYTTTEVRYMRADEPLSEPRVIMPRKHKVRYSVEHHGDYFYMLTNERAVNFKIMRAPVAQIGSALWKAWLPHSAKRSITGFAPFKNFLALVIREKGSEEIYISSPEGRREKVVFPEDGHTVALWDNLEYDSSYIRITYDSFTTPKTAFDYDVTDKHFTVRKKQEVPFYHKSTYVTKRVWARSGGVRVPIVLVHKKNIKKRAPLLLEAYGSYGICNDPHFSVARLSLLERGWVIALAHPRGGGELGWHWHKDAHLLTKHKTGDDFIAAAKYLIKQGYTTREKLAITGGSAGGMLMGQVLNREPELFGAALVYVPAADLVTSLSDESLGGTRLHYDEIGDPRNKKHYRYLMRHSPYEAVRETAYPAILVRASMHDVRTPYWEAAKWVARLREKKTDANPLYLKIETDGGHFGKSGRYEWIKERAFDYAFLLETMRKKV